MEELNLRRFRPLFWSVRLQANQKNLLSLKELKSSYYKIATTSMVKKKARLYMEEMNMRRFHPLNRFVWVCRDFHKSYIVVIICVSICCVQIRKNMRKKFKKQTHETHERHETHMVKLYIPLSSLILRKGREKINKFRKTHERHETHETRFNGSFVLIKMW
jgi:hypothetical protein